MQATMQKKAAIATNAEMVKSAMAAKMDSAAFTSWIDPLKISINNNHIELITPNQFCADFINRAYKNIIDSVAADFSCTAEIFVGRSDIRPSVAQNDNAVSTFVPVACAAPTVKFEDFIISEENSFAVSAAKKLCAGAATFSPLFIYGASGCGKSLLARCINSAASGRVVLMTGGQFVSDFLRSMRENSVFAFKDFCRNCDTFILDDLNTLAGKKASCEEFLELVIDLIKANKNVVLLANCAPASLGGFERRAQSVFASGLTVDLSAPNRTVRRAMLGRAGLAVDVAEFIAGRIAADGHLVSGVVNKIKTYSELMGEKITNDVAEKLLSDVMEKNKTPLAFVKSMCGRLGVSYDEICGAGRTRTLVRARQIIMTVLKSATNLSLAEIGRLVGDRDHATVLYGLAQIEKAKQTDLILAAEIDQLMSEK